MKRHLSFIFIRGKILVIFLCFTSFSLYLFVKVVVLVKCADAWIRNIFIIIYYLI